MIFPNLGKRNTNTKEITEKIYRYIDQLDTTKHLEKEEYQYLLDHISSDEVDYLYELGRNKTNIYYQNNVYIRGLIEITNYCIKGCNYCGIRSENSKVNRYRLTKEEILECVKQGYQLGIRSFVMQGGEDPYYTDELMCEIIRAFKKDYSDCALTLSIGEKSRETYQKYFDAGCERFLLRHETASKRLYEHLHPKWMSFENRMQCLKDLKEIGFQTGAGFMVNSPTQTNEDLVMDLMFVEEFQPHMCGIGPYIVHPDTPLAGNESGNVEQTTVLLSLIRLISPEILLPSTTALGTIDPMGREKGFNAGGMVVMPNLTPLSVRKNYEIYAEKKIWGDEAAESLRKTINKIEAAGYHASLTRGDHYDFEVNK